MSSFIGQLDQKPLMSNIQVRLRDRTLLFRYLVLVNLIVGAWYLQWRFTQSLNMEALWFSVPLLLAEAYMFTGGVLFLVGLWRPLERHVKSLSQLTPTLPTTDYPTVDIFITCYSEPIELVRETAQAALAMDYPASKLRVFILDDGNSSDMRAMAEQLCIQDLQSPALQRAAAEIEAERYYLSSRLEQVRYLKQDLDQIEESLSRQKIQLKTDFSELGPLMDWFTSIKQSMIPDKDWFAAQTLLGEGFDNVVSHAHKHLPIDTPIDLELVLLNSAIIIRIWDQGAPFDFEKHLQQLPDEVDRNAERGRGISILTQLADHLAYVREPNGRNCLTMIKQFIPQDSVDDYHYWQSQGQLQSARQLLLLTQSEYTNIQSTFDSEVRTLEAQIDKKTYVLSDLARCRYMARHKPKDRPHHAKAGNINHAIFCGETQGDFIVTLDADHIPKPQFLQRVLPNFFRFSLDRGRYELNKVAFVQTPQAFYNLPKGDPFGHDAHFFYGPIQQGKDGMNAAFYTGTNAILRREALVSMGLQHFADDFMADESRLDEFDLIGGVSSISITEDMNTAMRLHSAGWKSVYHHEILAEGLAPDDLSSTLTQKLRWAQGTIQVLVRDNPLFKSGLTFWQRLQYFQTMYSYFAGFFVTVFLFCPIISFFTELSPVSSYGGAFVLHFLPTYIINRLNLVAAGWGVPTRELWRNEQYTIALFPLQIQAVWSVLTGKEVSFKVTPKQRQSGVFWGLVRIQLIVFGLTIAGMLWGLAQLILGNWQDPLTYFVNVGWSCYHLALLWVVIRAAYWQPETPS
ncbi:glycosyltransferase family 2 protein [Leptothoe sp. PORK10 BA2]|uniref:glycosyltransferase family 2 protein n=1 Tax=Leptothoe sp. PORK10 BA2 TaxID=3110254 RepID=UPI002B1EE108|nr:glycosyltransferase family 2 protein [Leptothoe sp. PORK10 BA2]MEA5467001.1 glycosyltransferase family 2 protein [Leptothoe sp. PORK10 BA2]